MIVGILALQGCVEPHAKHLKAIGVEPRYVRLPEDLEGIQGLILPGGESTTMIRLAKNFGLWDALKTKAQEIPFWGVCAGSILMANKVVNPEQESLGIMDITVERNAYGRQLDSTQEAVTLDNKVEDAVFIRAPKFVSMGSDVFVEGKVGQEPVFLSSKKHMVTAFHPEITENHWCHEIFRQKIISLGNN